MLIAEFELSENLWWHKYYKPLERLIQTFLSKYPNDFELNKELKKDMIEIEKCKSKSVVFSSFFVIMKKVLN